jgi:hypothetical protein
MEEKQTREIARDVAHEEVHLFLRILTCPKCKTSTVFAQTLWHGGMQQKKLERCLNCLCLFQGQHVMVEVKPTTRALPDLPPDSEPRAGA